MELFAFNLRRFSCCHQAPGLPVLPCCSTCRAGDCQSMQVCNANIVRRGGKCVRPISLFSYSKLTPSFAVQRQKEFELAEFKMLHSEEGGERDQGGDRCRSSCPFFDQLPCVCQVLLDCCMVQGLGGLGLWKGKRATRVCI